MAAARSGKRVRKINNAGSREKKGDTQHPTPNTQRPTLNDQLINGPSLIGDTAESYEEDVTAYPSEDELNILESALFRLFESTRYLDDQALSNVLSALVIQIDSNKQKRDQNKMCLEGRDSMNFMDEWIDCYFIIVVLWSLGKWIQQGTLSLSSLANAATDEIDHADSARVAIALSAAASTSVAGGTGVISVIYQYDLVVVVVVMMMWWWMSYWCWFVLHNISSVKFVCHHKCLLSKTFSAPFNIICFGKSQFISITILYFFISWIPNSLLESPLCGRVRFAIWMWLSITRIHLYESLVLILSHFSFPKLWPENINRDLHQRPSNVFVLVVCVCLCYIEGNPIDCWPMQL